MRAGISLPVTFSDSATSLLQTYLKSTSKSWLFSKKTAVALTCTCSILGVYISSSFFLNQESFQPMVQKP